MARDRIVALLERMAARRIAVVGDVMLDRYLVGDTERLSPEAPVPVVTIRASRAALGGAANVAANVGAIGAVPLLAGVVGDDDHAIQIRSELAARQIPDRYLVTAPGRPTTTKTRVIARGQQVVRIDEETTTPLDDAGQERVLRAVLEVLPEADALVLEDYNKGLLEPGLIGPAIAAARNRGIPVVVDPKYRHFFQYRGATIFKPNRRELEAALGAAMDLDREPAALTEVVERLGVDHLVLTVGADGMVLVSRQGVPRQVPSLAREVYDVSGAGDTVTAWMATALAAGASLDEAAYLANVAAGVEVGKAGVATVAPDEVLAAHEERFDAIGRLRRSGVI
jgi:D-beta-D-heptose 7-phosphate kinase/D-beta-D-heptose 1-phosphate adenosyltransferase